MMNDLLLENRLDNDQDVGVFRARFWRCHQLLRFIACRVLGSPERADEAVAKCWLKASWNPPRFEYDSEFRSWLLRVLMMRLWPFGAEINEALKAKLSFEEIPSEHEINCTITNCAAEKTPQRESIENVYPVINQKLART